MAERVHPTAIVEKGATLGAGVEIGAYAFVGAAVTLGQGTRVHHHATVEGLTTLGQDCEVFPYACVGGRTQDLKYRGGKPGLRIGDRNVFREYVSIHAATNDGQFTVIGSDNSILAYSHVAHDCVLGNHIVMSNGAVMAGHVRIGNHVVLGGYSGIHQFCQVGDYAMLSACAKLVLDLPPFMIADGVPAVARAFNRVALERNGFKPEQIERVKQAFRIMYYGGFNRTQALEHIAAHENAATPEFKTLLDFAKSSTRGLISGSTEKS